MKCEKVVERDIIAGRKQKGLEMEIKKLRSLVYVHVLSCVFAVMLSSCSYTWWFLFRGAHLTVEIISTFLQRGFTFYLLDLLVLCCVR